MSGKIEKSFINGQVKATVWKNTSKAGNSFRTISLNRSYNKNGEWKNTNSFGVKDLDKAIENGEIVAGAITKENKFSILEE